MKDKTEAAKILLEKGWTLEEVLKVLGENKQVQLIPAPYPIPCPVYPQRPWIEWVYPYTTTTGETSTIFTFKSDDGGPSIIMEPQ